MPKLRLSIAAILAWWCGNAWSAAAEGFHAVPPRALRAGEVAVSQPGVYAAPGTTYVLVQDIVAPGSAVFLGNDVTLDLNGHTITYAGAAYHPVPNGSFEDGLASWDTGKAPHAAVEDRRWRNPIDGNKVCLLPRGEELVSAAVELPIADRAYYAMVAVASDQTAVDVSVEDAQGKPVTCEFKAGSNVRVTCPELHRSPKLGGGVVFALLFGKPAGAYRIRIKAVDHDCVIDDVDIRPALDTGIGVVGQVMPWAYYQCILDGDDCAFFELAPEVDAVRAKAVPVLKTPGTVTIRNGTIRAGAKGVRTWGILGTAEPVRMIIDNVAVVAAGTNTCAMRICGGEITDCRTELDWNWIIDRHRQSDYAVSVGGGAQPSRVADCTFIGGQGQLSMRGNGGEVVGNRFVNRQNVVNHYSLSACGGARIHGNRFVPEQGSGILIFRQSGVEVYDNDFAIHASPPVNEYSDQEYSVSAIRITDYNAKPGDPHGVCADNRIHHNRIAVSGQRFPEALSTYRPMAFGVFMSVGGGQNQVFENDVTVHQAELPNDERHGAYAFFIGGADAGGIYHHNRITSDVTPVWIATYYGAARDAVFHDNTFAVATGASAAFAPFRLGWHGHESSGIGFYSNHFVGMPFAVDVADAAAGYAVGWTLTVTGAPAAEVAVANSAGAEAARGRCDEHGRWTARLAQYQAHGDGHGPEQRVDVSAYRVTVGGVGKAIVMDGDRQVDF